MITDLIYCIRSSIKGKERREEKEHRRLNLLYMSLVPETIRSQVATLGTAVVGIVNEALSEVSHVYVRVCM